MAFIGVGRQGVGLNTGYNESWYQASGTGRLNNIEGLFQGLVDEQNRLNTLQMEREDTAYQRMVEDMRKAGLNPWTGISSGGLSSSSVVASNKSALDTLIQVLSYNEKNADNENKTLLNSINTAVKVAMPFLALLGI